MIEEECRQGSSFLPLQIFKEDSCCSHGSSETQNNEAQGAALRSTYGIANNELSDTPISYKQYLQFLLKSTTWGEDIVIYAISDLFRIKITSINATRLDEYRCRHNQSLNVVDAVLIFNGSSHYSYAGKWLFVLLTGRLQWAFVVD